MVPGKGRSPHTEVKDMAAILVGTRGGLFRFAPGGGKPSAILEGRSVDAIAPALWKRIWAVVDLHEIWRCDDLSTPSWTRAASLLDLGGATLRATCLADTRANAPDGILVGTSESHLVRIDGTGPVAVAAFDSTPGRDRWYTPWGGPPDVRSITEDRHAVYVNVHVGGVLRSRDEGASWQPTIEIDADVHRVVTGAGRVYAAGARGLSISADAGDTWHRSAHGLVGSYCRSVAMCGTALLVSGSDGPGGGRAAVYRSELDGSRFERCQQGLPEWFEGNIDSLCLDALPDGSLAAFAAESGDVFTSIDQGRSWACLAKGLSGISCVLVLP